MVTIVLSGEIVTAVTARQMSEKPMISCDRCGGVLGPALFIRSRTKGSFWKGYPPGPELHICARCAEFVMPGRWWESGCRGCGRVLVCSRADRRYCGPECRTLRMRKVRKHPHATCATCGDTFTPPRADGRYCSGACRQKAYRARKAVAS